MIGRLHGKLLEKNPPQILIDVSGVGYEVDVPMSTFCNLPEVGGELTLHTHFVVREDAELLYGFATLAERAVFRALIKISDWCWSSKVSSQAPAQRQRQCRPLAHVPTLRPRSSPWGIPNAKPLPRRRSSPRTVR